MNSEPILQFKSHTRGKNADVAIYADRIEWHQTGHFVRSKGGEVIPMRNVSSVATKRDGLVFTKVQVTTTGNTIDFRVAHADAERVKAAITSLLLGDHAAGQRPVNATAAPPPAGPPAGWYRDPQGQPLERWWDGSTWTDHTRTPDAPPPPPPR